MRALYTCVVNQHETSLVLLAAVVCLFGVYTTFQLANYVQLVPAQRERWFWGACTVVCLASATWATHFIAMLAFNPGMPAAFDPALTIGSFLVALIVIGAGISVILAAEDIKAHAAGGAVVGLGISLMHYVGMAAYETPGEVLWDTGSIAASVLASVGFATLSAAAFASPRRAVRQAAPPAMLLAICSLHFIGMSAVTVVYDPTRTLPFNSVQPKLLSVFVAGATLIVLLLAVTALLLTQSNRRRLRQEQQRFGTLTDVALEGLLICEGERITSANSSIASLCRCDASELVGLDLGQVLNGLSTTAVSDIAEQDAQLGFGQASVVPVRVLRRAIIVRSRTHQVIAVRDQRDRLRTEARIRSLAFSDPLTGLPNRTKLNEELERHVTSRRKQDGTFAIMMIDLDRFKIVNDTLGHAVGDAVLKEAAQRLKTASREGDVVARLGGDEFALLQLGLATPDATRAVAARIIELINCPFLINGHVINIGASVGMALAPRDGDTAETLLRNADLAVYHAKQAGRGTFRTFEPELDARMQQRRRLEQDLRRAVACQEFEVFYQPQVDVRSGSVSGAEALVRWRDPERGLVSPADFIPLAEEIGLIVDIGEWVLRTACAEATTWPPHLSVAVNLSPVQFRDPRLAETIKSALAATGLAPERLELEITEGVLMSDEARSLATLNELRSSGIRISMDDFGTGYSSLSYLRRFPFDRIKVDQSFIQQLPSDAESAAIVRAILTMATCLGLQTTVEGVETSEQLAFTSAEGCDHVQGYLFSRPIDAAAMARFVSDRKAA